MSTQPGNHDVTAIKILGTITSGTTDLEDALIAIAYAILYVGDELKTANLRPNILDKMEDVFSS